MPGGRSLQGVRIKSFLGFALIEGRFARYDFVSSLRQAYNMNFFSVNQTSNSHTNVVYVRNNVVGF